ncbi:MAG: NAD-dependent epimerase/dehydratase family protein [Devosiaceae bacterium]|nr:NAD-dependent epimerase/dehydratase family protein [Devosiaceae bacterium]
MQTITILGINGRIGQEVAKAFVAADWRVIGMGRGNRAKLKGVEFIEGDANYPEQTRRAVAEADVVFNGLNLPYDKWDKGRAEAILMNVLEALKGSGKTLLFPGNIYNFGEKQHLLMPDTPQRPARDKGRIRQRMEAKLAQAAAQDNLQVIILRLADFFAPGAEGSNFDLMIMSRLKSGILQYPGELSMGHSWAYLPDVGRAMVKIAKVRNTLPTFEILHYQGHFATGEQLIKAIQIVLPKRVKVKKVPMGLLKIFGWFVPVLREVVIMSYLWDIPHQLRDPKLKALLGEGFDTPFEEAVQKTALSYLPQEQRGTAKTRHSPA